MIQQKTFLKLTLWNFVLTALPILILFSISCKKIESPEPVPAAVLTYNDTIHTLYKDITSDTVLKNLGGNGVDYRIANFITISNGATLTIEAGVTVQMVQNGGFNIVNGAALKIIGTTASPVTITAQVKNKGFWKGIYFSNTANTNNSISNAVIEYAGSELYNTSKKAAVNVYNSTVSLNNSIIRNNKVNGCYFDSTAIISMHNCTITANDSFPVLMLHNNCGLLTNDNIYTGNGNDKIVIRAVAGVNSSHAITLNKLAIPYLVTGTCKFAHSLTIEAGTRFKMLRMSTLYFDNSVAGDAKIYASGAANDSIIMEGYFPDSSGYWQGITLHGGGIGQFSYCRISDAGTASDFGFTGKGGALFFSGGASGQIDVKHCLIKRSYGNGIVINVPDITYNADIETINTFTIIADSSVLYY